MLPLRVPEAKYSMLGIFTDKMSLIAPSFNIQGSEIKILSTPTEFYDILKVKLLGAEERIFISTLYIGKTENELISMLQKALRLRPKLKLSILTDALRGTRESPSASCASLLAPLVTEFSSERVEIRMYHTPNLTGLRKHLIPKRINEGWGLQHMKMYGFDDEIIITGANLSNDYFTNRQDRYHLFSSKTLTDHFFQLHSTISKLSFLLVPNLNILSGYSLEWPESNLATSPLNSPTNFISQTSKIVAQLTLVPRTQKKGHKISDTVVFPIIQVRPLCTPRNDISTELAAITSMLSTLASPRYKTSSWTFTAGYFNPIPELTSLLLSTASVSNTIITASPWANGFYGSTGVSRLIPSAYTLILRRFFEAIKKKCKTKNISIKEWRVGTVNEPGGWTYHAKGLWISLGQNNTTKSARVEITVLGSSNYSKRSYYHDLEAGVIIVTKSEELQMRLGQEKDDLEKFATKIEYNDLHKSHRSVSLKVRIAMWIVSLVGGAL